MDEWRGGEVTDSLEANGKTIEFKHGWRHLEGTGLNAAEVNNAIADNVSRLNLPVGQFYEGRVFVNGTEIIYRAMCLDTDLISIGTYFLA